MRHDDFAVVKVIGRGAFGEVQLVSSCHFLYKEWLKLGVSLCSMLCFFIC